MLVPGTQMHLLTLGFICIELLILFYLIIVRLARPDDRDTSLNVKLILLLIVYNITGGLLPDPNLPGSYFIQECIAYGTGFITPCYFPYYVYRGFDLAKMKFHARTGVYLFLVLPYFLFVLVFALSNELDTAKNILFLPVIYALWVLYSVVRAVRYKYGGNLRDRKPKEEIVVLFLSLAPWVGLPAIAYFNLSQAVEASTTNTGFLLLMALHLKRNVQQIRAEHQQAVEVKLTAEERLLSGFKQYGLTNREQEISRLIAKGFGNKQIAENLFIAEKTVAKHVQNIFEKVGVGSRVELCKKLGVPLGM